MCKKKDEKRCFLKVFLIESKLNKSTNFLLLLFYTNNYSHALFRNLFKIY